MSPAKDYSLSRRAHSATLATFFDWRAVVMNATITVPRIVEDSYTTALRTDSGRPWLRPDRPDHTWDAFTPAIAVGVEAVIHMGQIGFEPMTSDLGGRHSYPLSY